MREHRRIGPPPTDELDLPGWLLKHLAAELWAVLRDPKMRERERRSELKSAARTLDRLIPTARMRRAERLIKEEALRPAEEEQVELVDVDDKNDDKKE
jgi:hypothetical protein